MAGVTGLEPATSGVTGQRSNQLSYTPDEARLMYRSPSLSVKRLRRQFLGFLLLGGKVVAAFEHGEWKCITTDLGSVASS